MKSYGLLLNIPSLSLASWLVTLGAPGSARISPCTHQAEFTAGRSGETGGCFWLACIFCQSYMSSLWAIKCFSRTHHLGSAKWGVALSPPNLTPNPGARQQDSESNPFSSCPLSSILGIMAAWLVLSPSSLSRWDGQSPLSGPEWSQKVTTVLVCIGHGLVTPKTKTTASLSTSPATSRKKSFQRRKSWLTESFQNNLCLVIVGFLNVSTKSRVEGLEPKVGS